MSAEFSIDTPLRLANAEDVLSVLRERGPFKGALGRSALSACLPTLTAALNWPGRIRELCHALPSKDTPLDLVDCTNVLAVLGFRSTSMRLPIDAIDARLLPCLFVPDDTDADLPGPLVILGRDARGSGQITAFCGQSEAVVKLAGDGQRLGTVFLFEKVDPESEDEDFSRLRTGKTTWFRGVLSRFRSLFRHIFLTSLLLNFLSLAAPLFLMVVYDKVIATRAADELLYLLLGVLLAITAEAGLRYFRLRSTTWLGARVDYLVNTAIFEQLLKLGVTYTERTSVAAQIARVKSFESVKEFFVGPLFLLVLELPFSLVLIAAIACLAGSLALIPIVVAGLYGLIILLARRKLTDAIRASARATSSKQRQLVETLGKMDALRTSGMTAFSYERLREISGDAAYASFRSAFLSSIIETFAHGLTVLSGVTTIAIGVSLVISGQLTVGALIAAMMLTWRALAPLQTVCTMLPRLEQLRNSIAQVNRLMALEPESRRSDGSGLVKALKGRITFANVGLRYTRTSDPVFAGLSFETEPGQLVALTGSSGAGKSTILKLANRLYTPQAGSIRIDGADIRQIDPAELRMQVSYFPEIPHFFTGTIRENFQVIDPLLTEDRLREALERARAWDGLAALPDGLDTVVGHGHTEALPTGLTYRLGLARGYISDSPVMLFDELPYSVLNSEAGDAFKDFLLDAKGRRTVMFVTHRDDYVRIADLVVMLSRDARHIVGTPKEVQRVRRVA